MSSPRSNIHHSKKVIISSKVIPQINQFDSISLGWQESSHDSRYDFVLRNRNMEYSIENIQVNFAPLIDDKSGEYLRTIPSFNKDNKYWTPAFLIEADPFQLQAEQMKFRSKYNHFVDIIKSSKQNESVKQPDKIGDTLICGVCARKIRKYKKHIQRIDHKAKVRDSTGNKYINELIRDCHYSQNDSSSSDSATGLKSRALHTKKGRKQGKQCKRQKDKQNGSTILKVKLKEPSLQFSPVQSWQIEQSW